MVSILPNERTPFDVIGKDVGRALQNVLPQAAQQRSQRETGLSAIDRLQEQLKNSNGDISKILPDIARAITLNQNLERSGLIEHSLRNARTTNALGSSDGQSQVKNPIVNNSNLNISQNQNAEQNNPQSSVIDSVPNISGIIPNLDTDQDIDQKAKQWAISLQDPSEYERAKSRLYNERAQAEKQISKLENLAEEQGVSRQDMPEFMQLGKNHNYLKDPNKWVMATNKDWGPYKNAKEQLKNAFIPGFFRGLISSPEEREKKLDRLNEPVQEILKLNPALEPKIRADLQSEYLSPTEVELRIHPLTDKNKANLEKLPRGIFPNEKFGEGEANLKKGYPQKNNTFISYDEALKKAPKEMEIMNKRLVNFIKQNVDKDSTILGIRDKLWEKDYDWRQISDAFSEAQTGENAIKLSPDQKAELTQLKTQAPLQSLSDVFSDWGRWQDYLRGNK